MPRGLLIVLAAGLVVGVAVFEGIRSNRWGESKDVKAAAAKLERVPREFGAWTSGPDGTLDPKIVERAEAAGYLSRRYYSRKTGTEIDVMLLCGLPGPIGAHTPDVCYGGLGYECLGNPKPQRIAFGDGDATFWTARFEKKQSPTDQPLRVYWAWGIDGDWEATERPRREFIERSVLFKLYVQHTDGSGPAEPAKEFLTDFLPVLKKALTSDASTSPR
jgi:Protein of unknown function (DUF3485)